MSTVSRRTLFWAPRVLTIVFIAFVSLFALDVFEEGRGFWKTLVALAMHLIPSFVMVGILVLSWRWEWVGAALYTALAGLFLWWDHNYRHNALIAVLMLTVPLFLMAALFLVNWLKHDELRARPAMR